MDGEQCVSGFESEKIAMSFSDILLYVVLPLIVGGYFFLKKKYSFFKEKGIPHLKPSWTLGNMDGIGKTSHMADLMMKIYNECKGKDVVAGFYTMISPTYIVTDLELAKLITVKDFNNFVDRGVFVNEEDEPLTGGLFSITGDKWRFLRHKLSPVFTSGKIKMMYGTIADKATNFVKAIEKASSSGSMEVKEIANRYTIDVVASTSFGMESSTLNGENPELVKVFKNIFGDEGISTFYFFFLFAFPRFSKFFKLKQFNKYITTFFNDVIGGSIKHREDNNVVRNDLMNMLIQLKNKGSIDGEISTESRKLTLDEVIAQAFIFFFAGADTTSNVISFAMFELAQRPDIQEKMRQEINEKVKGSNGEITYENLHEMTYLIQVVSETLRKFPPAFVTVRQATSDYKIPNSKHLIEKGAQVMIPNIAFHYDEAFWKNPYEFNPDRFTKEEIAQRPNMSYIPFGEGPRNCIGMRFALVNVQVAIATVIRNFKVSLDTNKTQLPLKFDPKNPNIANLGGFWVNFEKI